MTQGSQLYVSIPAEFAGALQLVEAVIAVSGAPAIRITGDGEPGRLSALAAAVQGKGAAILLEDDAKLAESLGFDGVHLSLDNAAIGAARAVLGAEKMIGADCRLSRHEAMTLAEAGADYVAFGRDLDDTEASFEALAEMIAWWSPILEIPCAAYLPARASEEAWRSLAAAGADFLIPGLEIWEEPDTVLAEFGRLSALCGAPLLQSQRNG